MRHALSAPPANFYKALRSAVMENMIGIYIVTSIVVSSIWAIGDEDWRSLIRGLFWPLYLIQFIYKDLKG